MGGLGLAVTGEEEKIIIAWIQKKESPCWGAKDRDGRIESSGKEGY